MKSLTALEAPEQRVVLGLHLFFPDRLCQAPADRPVHLQKQHVAMTTSGTATYCKAQQRDVMTGG